jgi:hypothetical protein
MIVLWALVCAALYAVARRRGGSTGVVCAAAFAALSSQWLTYWMGQMMLVESYWGYAALLLVALLGTPLGFNFPAVARSEAAVAGALFGVLASASPACAPAFACLGLWAARDPRWRRRWRELAAGFAAWLAAFFLWCSGHVDLGQWYPSVITFNAKVYAPFWGISSAHPAAGLLARAVRENAAYFRSALTWESPEQYFEGVLKLSFVAWVWRMLVSRRYFDAGAWAALAVALRLRSERMPQGIPFHAAPFFLMATLLLSRQFALLWAAARRRAGWGWTAALLGFSVFFCLPTLMATSWAAASLKKYAGENVQYKMLVGAVRACTPASARIAVFPVYPRFYMDADRLPAVPSVFYLPWQDAWPGQRALTLNALERNSPSAVIIQDSSIWGMPWETYGKPIEDWLRRGYVSVAASAQPDEPLRVRLWVPAGSAADFVRCASKL